MFGIQNAKSSYPLKALWFENYPDLPRTETGVLFHFKRANGSEAKEQVISRLEYRKVQQTIETNEELHFKPESYVLIGRELFKIASVSIENTNSYAEAISHLVGKHYTLLLDRVDNGTEEEI